jgi:hypothetical protein
MLPRVELGEPTILGGIMLGEEVAVEDVAA